MSTMFRGICMADSDCSVVDCPAKSTGKESLATSFRCHLEFVRKRQQGSLVSAWLVPSRGIYLARVEAATSELNGTPSVHLLACSCLFVTLLCIVSVWMCRVRQHG